MTITQYLGTGAQSRGRLSINKLLNMQATTAPYLHNDADKAAVIAGLEKVQGYFKSISNLTWIRPAPNETATHYVDSVSDSWFIQTILFHHLRLLMLHSDTA